MNMNKDSITLFHKCRKGKQEDYVRFYFHNVDWQQDIGVKYLKYTKSSMNTDSDILLFVPYPDDMEYISPKRYDALENKKNYFTFATHDKIVKGIIDYEITDRQSLKDLELNYDDVVDIVRVEDCNMLGHFELECE